MMFIKLKTIVGGKTAASKATNFNKYLLYTDDKRYWNSFESILDEFEKRKLDVAFWTSSEDDPVFNKEYKEYSPVSEKDRKLIVEAYQKEKELFSKRLETYIKRYGLSKVNSWSYWRDE